MSFDLIPTDMLLLRMHGDLSAVNVLAPQLAAAPVCKELESSIVRHAWDEHSSTAYIYLGLPFRIALAMSMLAPLTEMTSHGVHMEVCRLALMRSIPGASRGLRASFHYVVETTPETGWEIELQRWYESEHLPGLASVQGCVQAQRFWNHDDGPRSFACYDVVDKQALDSPAWLAVRHTAWSDRVRPHFTRTARTMFTLQR